MRVRIHSDKGTLLMRGSDFVEPGSGDEVVACDVRRAPATGTVTEAEVLVRRKNGKYARFCVFGMNLHVLISDEVISEGAAESFLVRTASNPRL